jgi:Cu+-exporting ATPase
VTDVVALGEIIETDLLSLAAALERGSEHPLAEAIVEGAATQGAARQEAVDFDAVTGKGVRGRVGGRAVALGNAAMMQEMGLDSGAAESKADTLRAEGKTAMFVALDGALVGIVAVADPIKDSTAQAIRELHAQGLRVIMATGDNERMAQAVAGKLGIDEVRAGILPEAKKDLIDQLRRDGHKIAMAGDGVNDAPALAAADVGIAMGTGADVAMESAGITLLGGDLMGIVRARKLARATLRNIKQNLFFAFAYNALGVPIAAELLYPVTGLLLSPMIAAAAMLGRKVVMAMRDGFFFRRRPDRHGQRDRSGRDQRKHHECRRHARARAEPARQRVSDQPAAMRQCELRGKHRRAVLRQGRAAQEPT